MTNNVLGDTEVKQMLGQAEVEKALLRKTILSQAQEIESLKAEISGLEASLGIEKKDEEAVPD